MKLALKKSQLSPFYSIVFNIRRQRKTQEINPGSLALQADSLPPGHQGSRENTEIHRVGGGGGRRTCRVKRLHVDSTWSFKVGIPKRWFLFFKSDKSTPLPSPPSTCASARRAGLHVLLFLRVRLPVLPLLSPAVTRFIHSTALIHSSIHPNALGSIPLFTPTPFRTAWGWNWREKALKQKQTEDLQRTAAEGTRLAPRLPTVLRAATWLTATDVRPRDWLAWVTWEFMSSNQQAARGGGSRRGREATGALLSAQEHRGGDDAGRARGCGCCEGRSPGLTGSCAHCCPTPEV